MPILQVGEYQVINYDTFWIRRAIDNAVRRSGLNEFIFVDDIYDGIIYYLENNCSLRLLPLEALFDRIRHTLKRIGYESIANALKIESPPITISLERAATQAGSGYELAFYNILQQEMKKLKELGSQEIFFSDLKESVLKLKQMDQWDESCEQLENDIMLWLKNAGTQPQRLGHRIRCTLKKVAV